MRLHTLGNPGNGLLCPSASSSSHVEMKAARRMLFRAFSAAGPNSYGHRQSGRQVATSAKKGGKNANTDADVDTGPYSASVKLPNTTFSLRANSVVREPEIQKFWEDHQVYNSLLQSNPGGPFTLHDGPPYANGDLHIGHALNKVLKDFINRYQLLRGRKAKFVPGWDTHGLPIELKVLQGLKEEERRSLDTLSLRRKAREFALKTVNEQRKQFKRYGVWGDWDSPYITLDPAYEAAQLGVFGAMVLRGHIYRGRKPVYWSPSSRTALAEAELEYPEGHTSRSIYVAMPMVQIGPNVPEQQRAMLEGASFAIWTTTPWTIPANLAVAVNDQLDYALVEAQGEASETWKSRRFIVAQDLVESLQEKLGVTLAVVGSLKGGQLEGCTYRHPLFDRVSPVVVGGDYITTDSGTGLVHTAPGHGAEDYKVGLRYGLPLLSPVDDAGCFTDEAGPFAGLNVLGDGNTAVITALKEAGVLLREEAYLHKYPYDWRTKKPTIFRATDQWFASVEGFRQDALSAIRGVSWVPASGENRINSMTEGRSDWCISRQRKWGVPIPVFYDIETGAPLMTAETMAHVQQVVAARGSDAWWELPIEELLPPALRGLAPSLRRGEDTMDVWFDSGSSWAGVVQTVPGLNFPADVYLEGSDQHRGWFQSSLLTSVAANGAAPYRQVITHGFILDEKGLKMSKSLGNTLDPRTVIEGGKDAKKDPPYGADVLRLWVASVDYSSDVLVGPGILKQMAEVYRKLRGTLRFLLGNLCDFDPTQHAVPYSALPAVDRYMLAGLAALVQDAAAAYDTYQFYRIFQVVQRYTVVDLSSFYLDIAKDRLYIRGSDDASRRSCQTVLHALLGGMLGVLAPLVPHMAEDAWLAVPYAKGQQSVFQGGWPVVPAEWASGVTQDEIRDWTAILQLRDMVNKVLEQVRSAKLIGASLEAKVQIALPGGRLRSTLEQLQASSNTVDELRYLFIVSQADVAPDAATVQQLPHHSSAQLEGVGEVVVGVSRASGNKCSRCWNYSSAVGAAQDHPQLCERCLPIVRQLGSWLPSTTTPVVA